MKKHSLFLLALTYRFFYKVNRFLFLRKKRPLKHSKLIVVGAYLIGGAGKTPFTLHLAQHFLSENKSVAILCHAKANDEFLWLQQKLPHVKVFKTKNRASLASRLDGQFDVILTDDGFEDHRLVPDEKIALQWGESTHYIRDLIPSGFCRSLKRDHLDITRTVFCGDSFINPDLLFYISKIVNAGGESLTAGATAMCGIGSPQRFFADLEKFGAIIHKRVERPDHDRRFETHLKKELSLSNPIVITEKDFSRLSPEIRNNPLLFMAEQKVAILSRSIS